MIILIIAGIYLVFTVIRGWQLGVARMSVRVIAVLVAYAGGWFLAPVAVPFLRPISLPDFILRTISGGIIGVAIFFSIVLLSALLFKRTSQQTLPPVRFIYGAGGGLLGAVFAAVIVAMILISIRVAGSFTEASMPSRDDPTPASQRQSPWLSSLAQLKRSLEEGPAGAVVAAADPVPDQVYRVVGKTGYVLADPIRVRRLLSFEGFKSMAENERLLALRDDPEIQKHIREKDYVSLLRNKQFVEALNDPELQRRLSDFPLEEALDHASDIQF